MFSLDKNKADEFINHTQKEDIDYIKQSAEAFDDNQKQVKQCIKARINYNNPRSMYLFYVKVKRVLSKNHGGVPPKGLWNDLMELEHDARNYYHCDAYLEKTSTYKYIT